MKKVMVFGTFDGVHEGHLDFFRQAKEFGDYLIVVIGRDKNVARIKGHAPQKNEQERLLEAQKNEFVDEVRLGHETDPLALIEEIKPDVICLGYDQKGYAEGLAEKLQGRGLDIEINRLKPYKPDEFHSSILNKQ